MTTDRIVQFTDSWGLAWWVFEEPYTQRVALDGRTAVLVPERRLCFSTDMITRALDSCPAGWWELGTARLEALCSYATPRLVHALPADRAPAHMPAPASAPRAVSSRPLRALAGASSAPTDRPRPLAAGSTGRAS